MCYKLNTDHDFYYVRTDTVHQPDYPHDPQPPLKPWGQRGTHPLILCKVLGPEPGRARWVVDEQVEPRAPAREEPGPRER